MKTHFLPWDGRVRLPSSLDKLKEQMAELDQAVGRNTQAVKPLLEAIENYLKEGRSASSVGNATNRDQ